MPDNNLFIGLMSGTSADSIDAALVDFSGTQPRLLAHIEHPIESHLKQHILQLCLPGTNEIDRMGSLDCQLGELFSHTVHALLQQAGVSASQITAIGSHGQTIRHRPAFERPFTLQIGDPNTIAQLTGITTVADFRRRDMAAGGQGAPLVPAFHRAAFAEDHCTRAIVNIGGMANVTYLAPEQAVIGFDTGPGNVLMDGWIEQHQGVGYDRDGRWAASGRCSDKLLEALLQHPYFSREIPKSTGREDFNLEWLQQVINRVQPDARATDVQATLLELTAVSIARELFKLAQTQKFEIYICGGGAYNPQLLARLKKHLGGNFVATTSELGIEPKWVEAVAFAWLAKQTLHRQPGNIPSVTGADQALPLGGIYFA